MPGDKQASVLASVPILDEAQARAITGRILAHAGRDQVEVVLYSNDSALTRCANNIIHQNVDDVDRTISVRVLHDGRVGSVTTNQIDDTTLDGLLSRARRVAEVLPHDPHLPPLPGPAPVRPLPAEAEATLQASPEDRADGVMEMIAPATEAGLTAAGTFSTSVNVQAVANSRGVFAFHRSTAAALTLTVLAEDSSGWGEEHSRDAAALRPRALGERIVDKAVCGARPVEIDPGEYDVVLEANAVAELMNFLPWLGFSALAYEEGRSFMSGKMGQMITGERITIADDAYDPRTLGTPFDAEGVPRQRVVLIDHGVASHVVYDTQTAARAGVQSTGHSLLQPNIYGPLAQNLVVATGDSSLDEMIATTERGILVTRFWYNRVVDPLQTIITGMTRDGTFLIENGRVVTGVRNLRFNESVLGMLTRADMIGHDAVLTSTVVAPPMRVRNFRFTGVTRF
jgi:predicted Zn-dependent protease